MEILLLKKQQLQTKPDTTTDIANTHKSKYSLLTPEQKENYKIKRQHTRANMTQEQRDAYNSKQRQYYQHHCRSWRQV